MKVEIWSDVVCPWCYVGKRRFERALEQFPHPVEVTWKSFQLDPNATTTGPGQHAQHLADKFGVPLAQAQGMLETMTETAAAEGLEFHFEKAQGGNTFDAHRLLHLAHEVGVQNALKERLVKAYFSDGEAIDDPDTLVRLAVETGIPEDRARKVVEGDEYSDELHRDVQEAQQLGITGVPFFVLDRRFGVSGAQSSEVLLNALTQAWETQSPLAMVTTTGGDACEGDACAV